VIFHLKVKVKCVFKTTIFYLIDLLIYIPFIHTRFEKQAPSKAKLKEEIDQLKMVLLKHNCPVVFCHNDMLCKNIVYDKTKGRSYNFMM